MKTRIIDIFNKIVNKEEIPQKIIYGYCEYTYDSEEKNYINKNGLYLFENLFFEANPLLKEVEIVEDKPEKIKLLDIEIENLHTNNCYIRNEQGTKCFLTKHSKILAVQLNEIAKAVNYLLEKSEK